MKQPKNDGFENAWQEAFEKASLAPPDIIWKNIESALPTESLGVKPSAEGLATASKLIIGTGIILISGLSYLYLNDSSSNNYTTKTNQISNGKNITKPNEPAAVDSKIENENLAISSPVVAKKHFVPEIKKNAITLGNSKRKYSIYFLQPFAVQSWVKPAFQKNIFLLFVNFFSIIWQFCEAIKKILGLVDNHFRQEENYLEHQQNLP